MDEKRRRFSFERAQASMDEKRRRFSFERAQASKEWIRPESKGNERPAVDG